MENLIIRKVELSNLEKYSSLFELCFGITVTVDYFNWKYLNNPHGSLIAFEAYDPETDTIAAFYGVIPELYSVNGVDKIIYQSMDTMTHPNYRNRGLFIKLANCTYDYLLATYHEVNLIGIPGSNSYHGFVKKLNWINPIHFTYVFTTPLLIKATNLFSKKTTITFKTTTLFNTTIDDFFAKKTNSNSIYKKYSAALLNWKITQHPFKKHIALQLYDGTNCVAIAIAEQEENTIKLLFFECLNEANYSALFKQTLHYFDSNYTFNYLYTWHTLLKNKNGVLLGLIKNPFNKGLFSYKVPLILYYKEIDNKNSNWLQAHNFDLHPLIQD
ncbi:MAG: GNAT family N-acetyltransferase [Bacteroidia bacterium]